MEILACFTFNPSRRKTSRHVHCRIAYVISTTWQRCFPTSRRQKLLINMRHHRDRRRIRTTSSRPSKPFCPIRCRAATQFMEHRAISRFSRRILFVTHLRFPGEWLGKINFSYIKTFSHAFTTYKLSSLFTNKSVTLVHLKVLIDSNFVAKISVQKLFRFNNNISLSLEIFSWL